MPKSFSEQERKIIKQSMIDIGATLMRIKSVKQITVDEIIDIAKQECDAKTKIRKIFYLISCCVVTKYGL